MTEPTKRIPSLVALGGGHGLSATLKAGRLVADHVTAAHAQLPARLDTLAS